MSNARTRSPHGSVSPSSPRDDRALERNDLRVGTERPAIEQNFARLISPLSGNLTRAGDAAAEVWGATSSRMKSFHVCAATLALALIGACPAAFAQSAETEAGIPDDDTPVSPPDRLTGARDEGEEDGGAPAGSTGPKLTIGNGTPRYERGMIDTEKLDAILLERLQIVARELVRDGIKHAFSTESAALRLIIEDTVDGIKELRGKQLANRVAADALVLFVSLHEADALARGAICEEPGKLRDGADIEKDLDALAIGLAAALDQYPKDGDALKIEKIVEGTYRKELAEWVAKTSADKNLAAAVCNPNGLWPVLRNLKTDGKMLQAQWLLIDAGFERTIRFFLLPATTGSGARSKVVDLAKSHWGIGMGVVAKTIGDQIAQLVPEKTESGEPVAESFGAEVNVRMFGNSEISGAIETAMPPSKTGIDDHHLLCLKGSVAATFCQLYEAELPKDGHLVKVLRTLVQENFGSYLASLLGNEKAKKLIEIYSYFMEFADIRDGEIEIDVESFLVSFYREFDARGHLRFYLSIGATGGVVYQYKAEEKTTPILYSEKLGLQIAWQPTIAGERKFELHSNIYVGGLLYSLAVAATDEDDDNPYAASAIIGIDPIGVKLYQAIEINWSGFAVAPFSGDRPWSWGTGINLAVPLVDYLSGDPS